MKKALMLIVCASFVTLAGCESPKEESRRDKKHNIKIHKVGDTAKGYIHNHNSFVVKVDIFSSTGEPLETTEEIGPGCKNYRKISYGQMFRVLEPPYPDEKDWKVLTEIVFLPQPAPPQPAQD